MKNLIVLFAILIASAYNAYANGSMQADGMKAKAVSAVVADQPGAAKAKTITPAQREAEKAGDEAVDPQPKQAVKDSVVSDETDTIGAETMLAETDSADTFAAPVESEGFHKSLKKKFIEGNAGFMSLVAIVLVLGLAFCIERIIYLTLSEIDTKRFMADLDAKITADDIEGAKELCRNTRGPVASICYQGLVRLADPIESIERSISSYGVVQSGNLEKGCSWITFFIAVAPSLGFLGTVTGMVMAFDQIQSAGDISPTIVAAGMKVALVTTIFGIIVALVLQLFYNYILSKIETLISGMEESAITMLDIIAKYKSAR